MNDLTAEEWAAKVWETEIDKGGKYPFIFITYSIKEEDLTCLASCFDWYKSPEGGHYWSNVHLTNSNLAPHDKAKLTALLKLHEAHNAEE